MSRYLQATQSFDVLLDDDRANQAADLVGLEVVGGELHITLVHCKFSSESTPGARVADLYELCGQAMRSAKWRQQGAQPLLFTWTVVPATPPLPEADLGDFATAVRQVN
jgi:hypothetical protein